MKVLIVGLAIVTAWLITSTIKNRNKIQYLRNQVAQVKTILIKIKKDGKETKTKKGEA